MLQFWCLFPLRVAYHGPFRENLESAFWGFGVSYHNLIRQVRVFKTEHLKCWSFDASPQSEWLITAHLERISAFWGFGVSYLSLFRQIRKGTSEMAVLMPLWLITAHLERIWSHHFGAWTVICHITTWLETHASLQNGAFEMLQFWCLSPVRVAYHGSFRENLGSAFWGALDCHITTWLSRHLDASLQNGASWNVAVLMPLPCQSGLSRLI